MSIQTNMICDLLVKLEDKYLQNESICQIIVDDNTYKQNKVEIVDALCQTILTSLNFKDYKRATRYLALTVGFCEQNL